MPASAAAASRSSTPANRTTSLPLAAEAASTVSGPTPAASVRSTDPGAYRSSGSSVHGSTKTSPRTPRARPIRPTATSSAKSSAPAATGRGAGRSAAVDVDDVDAHALAADAGDDLAQGLRGAPAAADHPAQVVGVHPHLEPAAAAVVDQVDAHVVGMVDDAADQVLDGLLEHVSSPPGRPCSPPPLR